MRATSAFLNLDGDRDDTLDDFEDAVRKEAAGGASHGGAVQLGALQPLAATTGRR